MLRSLYLFILSCIGLFVNAQYKPAPVENALLWKITGNNLKAPSYLFGTMHVTDKRVFFFGDSLYHSLEQTEGFATELDMSDISSQFISDFVDNKDDPRRTKPLTELIDATTLSKYTKQLEKKFKKPVSKITLAEIESEESKWSQDMLRNGEMLTFMDAYLFDLARKEGKWVGGIEDYEDQSKAMETETIEDKIQSAITDRDRMAKGLDWMIKTYMKEDIFSIDRSNFVWQGGRDVVLIKRNIKMSNRIDSLAHVRRCLFAIGAAHLPGDSGVVTLLRKKGFTVTPVYSSEKIAPEKYAVAAKTVNVPWVNIHPQDSSYNVQMPGKANKMDIGEESLDMNMYFDVISMRGYVTMLMPVDPTINPNKDTLINRLARYYQKKFDEVHDKKVNVGGEEGKEFVVHSGDGELRMQIFIPGNYAVLNFIYAFKKENLFGGDADRFMESFTVAKKNIAKEVAPAGDWKTNNYPFDGFSLMFPGKVKEKVSTDNDVWVIKQYQMYNAADTTYYGIVVHEAKPGYYSDQDSVYFESVVDHFRESMNASIDSTKHFSFDNYPAFECYFTDSTGSVNLRLLLINKGNRRYYMFTSTDHKNSRVGVNRFFSSFKFLPVSKQVWKEYRSPDNNFTVWAPSAIKKYDDSEMLYVYDSLTSTTVNFNKVALPSYYWAESDSVIFARRLDTYIGSGDSLLESHKVENGLARGMEYTIRLANTHNRKKIRLLLSADTLYTNFGFLPTEQLVSADYKKLFESIRYSNAQPPSSKLYERKPAALLTALNTKDSAEFATASNIFSLMKFEKQDVPLLQKALLNLYWDFDTSYSSGMSTDILNKIIELDSTQSSIKFVRENYKNISPGNEYVKPYLLKLLSRIKTNESYLLLGDLVVQYAPDVETDYYFPPLADTLALSAIMFPGVLNAIAYPSLFEEFTYIAKRLLDEKLISNEMIIQNKAPIISIAKSELTHSKVELQTHASQYYDLVDLLGIIKTAEANALISQFKKVDHETLRFHCVVALVKNNQPVSKAELVKFASENAFRIELYNELKEAGKLALYPAEYLSQKQFGESAIFKATDDEDNHVEEIKFVGTRVIGKTMRYYLYEVRISGDSSYLGIAGPYSPLNPKDVLGKGGTTGIYWEEYFDKGKIDEYFKAFLKSKVDDMDR